MLPEDWKKEIDQTVSEAKSAYTDAQDRSAEQNREIATRIEALTCQLKRYNSKQESDEPRKRSRERWTIGGLIATAVFTFALAGFSAWQVCETRRAYGPIQESATAAKKAAEAAERQSFAGRAYLFPRYVFNAESLRAQTDGGIREGITDPKYVRMPRYKINFCIDNAGQTPGMISRIDAHLYMAADKILVSGSDDIEAPGIAETRETMAGLVIAPDGRFFDADRGFSSEPVSIPGGSNSCGFFRSFVHQGGTNHGLHGSLLYIYIVYNDIFGVTERHTWYEVGLYGAGSSPGLKKYNHWD